MRKLAILTYCCLLCLLGGCIKQKETANASDLQFLSGISNHKLMFEGIKGYETKFTFIAKHDWQIIDYSGFVCNPSSGPKTVDNERTTVYATTLYANNSADTIRLSDLNFKLLDTRFVGISAHQLPQLRIKGSPTVTVSAGEGAKATATIVSLAEVVEVRTEGDIKVDLGKKDIRNERTVNITALRSNESPNEKSIGKVEFWIDGVKQGGIITVSQLPSIVFDREDILLPGHKGGYTIFEAQSDFEIEYTYSSDLFSVSAVEGRPNAFKIVANSQNDTDSEISLGSITFYLKNSPSCYRTINIRQRKAEVSQTVIVHFIGTALKSYYNENLKKMVEALNRNIQGDSRIVVITTDSTTDATLYELRYDSVMGKVIQEKIKELPLSNIYNTAIFEANLREAITFAPAQKYALVIGSHGLGWIPKESSSRSSHTLMRMGLSPATLWERHKDAEMTRHIGDNLLTRYDITEIAAAIKANNIKFDYILFDACFMSNIESVYELRDAAKYIIGSPCEIMGYGFPYAKIMPYMFVDNGSNYDIDKICYAYVDYYKNVAATKSACVAVTNTAELEALAATVKEVNKAAIKSDFALSDVQYYEGGSPHSFYDLEDLIEKSCTDATAVSNFKKQLDKTVTSRYHTTQFYSAYDNKLHDILYYSGITTSAMVEHYQTDWQQTSWYKATH